MSNLPALNEGDYEAIEAAVMETARGRWFLKAYAQRNRQTDTNVVLKALDRIEATLRGEQDAQHSDRMRFDLIDMATAISRTKAEIAAIKPDAGHHGKIGDATSELDAIVQTTELATSDILAAAEQIQEIAWTLREQGVDPKVCDTLDAKATEIYSACSFQDLTGQRTQKVIQVMRYLEGRINAMIDIWGLDGAMAAEAAESETARKDAELLNGPALPGQGLNQLDVDMVIGPVEFASAHERPGGLRVSKTLQGFEPEARSLKPEIETEAGSDFFWSGKARDFTPISKALPPATQLPPQPPIAQPRTLSRNDALASIDQLSYEEKLALFT